MDIRVVTKSSDMFYGGVANLNIVRNQDGTVNFVQAYCSDQVGHWKTMVFGRRDDGETNIHVYTGVQTTVVMIPRDRSSDVLQAQVQREAQVKAESDQVGAMPFPPERALPMRPTVEGYARFIEEGGPIEQRFLNDTIEAYKGVAKSKMLATLAQAFTELGKIKNIRAAVEVICPTVTDGSAAWEVLQRLEQSEKRTRRSIMSFGIICRWMTYNDLEKVEWVS